MNKAKIAIIGTGNIAKKLAVAMQKAKNADLYAVISRDISKAEEFASNFSIPNYYGSYGEGLNDKNIDLVYIAVPHAFHYELTKMCLNAGKNVLCEKPMTINAKQAKEIFDLACEKKLFFSEAMWTRFLPSIKIVKDLIDSGCIGKPKFLTANVGYNCLDIPRMTEPELAGGILLDGGIYILTSAQLLFGEEITSITTDCQLSEKGIDLRSTTTLTYNDGKTATLTMSMDACTESNIIISGEVGYIKINVPYNWQDIKVHIKATKEIKNIEIPTQIAGGYEYMVERVCDSIQKNNIYCEETSAEKTLFIMKLMDELRSRWNMKYPFED